MIKRFLTYIALYLGMIWNTHAAPTLYLLSNQGTGDHNQLLGISRVVKRLDPQIEIRDLDTKTTAPSAIKESVASDLKHDRVFVLGAGEGGLSGITELSPNAKLTICLTSHMYLPGYKDVANTVSFFALPSHATTQCKDVLGEKLIETTGVAHNRDPIVADITYSKWGKTDLPKAESYFVVVLGGDAPTPTKETLLFTRDDATRLANYVAKNAGNSVVIVLNGPRTGKHDDHKQEIKTAHRDGKLDRVTQSFKEALESKMSPEKVVVMDFQFDSKSPYNSFDLALGAVRATNGKMVVPGESTSMVSEAVDSLPQGSVLVYKNGAMNEVHEAHVKSEFDGHRISILKDYATVVTPASSQGEIRSSAAELIAKKLLGNI